MKFIELFAGIGAFRMGLENTGHECVWSNEWLEKPRRIYERNFGDKPDGRDIRDVLATDLPDADLICGGFPCATFSVAGKRTGFSLEDTRGTLAFEMFRLARDKGIPYILFENVKGLLNHDGGRTFGILIEVLDEMGYDCQWELLDSQNFGVPQHRERIFVIANLRGKPRPKVFPIGQAKRDDTEDKEVHRKEIFGSLQARMRKGLGNTESRITSVLVDPEKGEKLTKLDDILMTQWRRGHFRDYKSEGTPTLTANMGTGGHNVPFIKQIKELGNGRQGNRVYETENGVSPTLRGVGGGVGGKGALIKVSVAIETEEGQSIRKLTPLECERLQGFPDNFTKYYEDGSLVSDSERYERCGRTITIPVVEAMGRKLHEFYD